MEDFYRRIKLKVHFKNAENKDWFTEEDIFRNPTNKTWFPNNNHPSIETFIEATHNEINNEIEKMKQPNYSNLSVKEQKALQVLQSNDGIVITEADKGGVVVILDVEDYIKEAERQLHNTENYKRLYHNPTTTNNDTVNKIIKRFHKENLISENTAEGLKIESPKSPHFYLKPKLHKGVLRRPNVSPVNCHTSKISEYVDYHLQQIVRDIPSYVKDTSDLLRKINAFEFVPDNSYLESLDVKSLYTSILNAKGIKAAEKSLNNHPK